MTISVAHITVSDYSGGAGKAAFRLHQSLLDADVRSSMHVLFKRSTDPDTHGLRFRDQAKLMLAYRLEQWYLKKRWPQWNPNDAFSLSNIGGSDLTNQPGIKNADILHFHWINEGFLSLSKLRSLCLPGQRAVFTLHDSWPSTGGCHVSGDCSRFKEGCGRCPILGSKSDRDTSAKQIKKKRVLYRSIDPTFIAPSQWMCQRVSASKATADFRIEHIPNTLSTDIFKPLNRQGSRRLLGLPETGIILGYGARNVESTKYKGLDHLTQALDHLAEKNETPFQLAVFGTSQIKHSGTYPTRCLGYLHDDYSLAAFYNAVDLMVVPSLEDNFPNVILESLSCGTSVVAYRTGGIPEMIVDGKTGLVVEKGNSEALCESISQGLNIIPQRTEIRDWVETHCSPKIVASQHIELYSSLLKK